MTTKLQPYIVRDMLEDHDVFGYIKSGSHADAYDRQSAYINDHLSKDLSIDQISKIIWEAFYRELCVCEHFSINRKTAKSIVGDPERFDPIAKEIRKQMAY
jgi:hypothetical protein